MRLIDADAFECLSWEDGEHGTTFDDGVIWMCELIDKQPTVKPEQKYGEWVRHYDKQFLIDPDMCRGGVRCTSCGYKTYNKMHLILGCKFKYCPNCGAYMRKDKKK